jgi:hypothetical protein
MSRRRAGFIVAWLAGLGLAAASPADSPDLPSPKPEEPKPKPEEPKPKPRPQPKPEPMPDGGPPADAGPRKPKPGDHKSSSVKAIVPDDMSATSTAWSLT